MDSFTLTLPEIYCPFPIMINPAAEALERHTAQWVFDFKLVNNNGRAVARFDTSKFSRLVARACPTAAFDDLTIASDLMALLFLLDDHCDETTIGKQPHLLKLVFAQMLSIMSEPLNPESKDARVKGGGINHLANDLEPFIVALENIWQRIQGRCSRSWLQRFIRNLQDSIEANLWEAQNRATKLIPSLATYITKRALTNGFYWCQNLSELVERINLPEEVLDSVEVRRLAQTATNVTGWFNDIVSLGKEMRSGDNHNLVLILQHHYQINDLQEALDKAVALHNNEVQTFIRLDQELPSFEPAIDLELKRYVAAMRLWMRSNVDWSFESGRYHEHHPSTSLPVFSEAV